MTEEQPVTLDEDTTKPSVGAPGYGPADTTDPYELATSVKARPGEEALRTGTVNAVIPVGRIPKPRTEWLDTDRTERERVTRPDGTPVTVERNLELGVSRIIDED